MRTARGFATAITSGISLLALAVAGHAAELRFEEIPAPQDDAAKR